MALRGIPPKNVGKIGRFGLPLPRNPHKGK
jgi:hypothetical protein